MKSFLHIILAITISLHAPVWAEEKPDAKPVEVKILKDEDIKKAPPEPVISKEAKKETEKPAPDKIENAQEDDIEPEQGNDGQITTLEEALIRAYEYNPDLKSTIAELEATNELSSQAFAEWLPTASANLDYGKRQSKFGTAPSGTRDIRSKSLDIEQPLFKGSIGAKSDQAENLIKSAQYQFQTVEQSVILQTVTAYMNLITDKAILKLAKNKEKVLEKQLEQTQARFEVGELTKTDVSQAQARLALTGAEKASAETKYETSKANFERLTGEIPGALKHPTKLPAIPANLEEALKEAKKYNPVVNSAKFSEAAAENQIDLYTGALLPKLSVIASASREQDNSFSGSDFSDDSVKLNVNIPLYQSGSEYSRIRQSKKMASSAKFEVLSASTRASEETRAAWKNIKSATANIEANEQAMKAAEIALEGVRAEEEGGLRTIIDVLDAEQELFSAKTSLLNAKRDQIIAYYTLLDKIGKLTARDLALKTDIYDQNEALDDVKYKFIGF